MVDVDFIRAWCHSFSWWRQSLVHAHEFYQQYSNGWTAVWLCGTIKQSHWLCDDEQTMNRRARYKPMIDKKKYLYHSWWESLAIHHRAYNMISSHLISIYNEAWMSFSIIFDEPQLMFGNKSSENWTSIKHIDWNVCILMEKPTPNSQRTHQTIYIYKQSISV